MREAGVFIFHSLLISVKNEDSLFFICYAEVIKVPSADVGLFEFVLSII